MRMTRTECFERGGAHLEIRKKKKEEEKNLGGSPQDEKHTSIEKLRLRRNAEAGRTQRSIKVE